MYMYMIDKVPTVLYRIGSLESLGTATKLA